MYLLSYSSRCIWVSISSSHSTSILFIHICIVCSCLHLHFMLCLFSIHIHSISLRKLVGLHVMLKSIIRVLWCSIITDEVLRVLIGQRVSTQHSNCSKSLRSRGEEKNKDNSLDFSWCCLANLSWTCSNKLETLLLLREYLHNRYH